MTTATLEALRRQLEERQTRLRTTISNDGSEPHLVGLLLQVDSALDKLGTADYGRCLVCDEHVDDKELRHNPLLQYCLCTLTREQQRALEQDLELARRIQAGLLPDPRLRAAGWEASYHYEPAGMVSGDYCDLWRQPDDPNTVYFAVGDVAGKGVAASLLMAHLQASFRSLVGAGLPLAELVARVNEQLVRATIPTHYATLAFGRAGAGGEVEIVNAGHCPPLVVRAGAVEALAPTGFPVGIVSDRPYEVTRLELRDDDALLLYTDGLTEAERFDGDEYGQTRVEQLLSRRSSHTAGARQLVQAVRGDLEAFLGDAKRADDLTVMALRRANGAG
ncbi:MAG: serine/threonine-protein phosphatase [Candidatus Krumholzibacteria bacterium]|nr:serine/threonine-protein phosphatase [Candidatus Krumholzibacteria bacterium]